MTTPLSPTSSPDPSPSEPWIDGEEDDNLPEDIPSSQESAARQASVPLSAAGERLDKWLASTFPDISRSRLKALIEGGCVTLNAQTIEDASARVKSGQSVNLCIPAATPALPVPQDIPLTIVFEDEHLIVIDKPAGLVVHPAPGSPDGTLVNALLHHCGDRLSGIGGVKRPGIVHRIDKDTSGLLVVAKTDLAHTGLAEQFAEKTSERAYRALVWGVPHPMSGEIVGNIGRSPTNRQKMAVVKRGGKPALTRYRVLERYLDGLVSLVECRLATGRTHQIRVHMTHIGHTLVGDPVYGSSHRHMRKNGVPPEAAASLTSFPRQALHAYLLGFVHPATQEKLHFESVLPSDFLNLLAACGAPDR